jgi:hypothetical protein
VAGTEGGHDRVQDIVSLSFEAPVPEKGPSRNLADVWDVHLQCFETSVEPGPCLLGVSHRKAEKPPEAYLRMYFSNSSPVLRNGLKELVETCQPTMKRANTVQRATTMPSRLSCSQTFSAP